MANVFDSYTFGAWYAAQLRFIDEDTEEYWREVRDPGMDVSDLPQEVQEEIGKVWTPEVVSAFENRPTEPPESLMTPPPKAMTAKQQRLDREAKIAKEAVAETMSDIEATVRRVVQ